MHRGPQLGAVARKQCQAGIKIGVHALVPPNSVVTALILTGKRGEQFPAINQGDVYAKVWKL
jgi:hypothetical protein